MAQDIVSGLFGLSPWEVEQQRNKQYQSDALAYAKLSPFERANALGYQAGVGMGKIGAGMLGLQDPAVAEAQQRQAVMSSGGDLTTIEGMMTKAEQLRQAGLQREAMVLTLKAQEMQKAERQALVDAAKIKREEALAAQANANAERLGRDTPTSQAAAIQEYQLAKNTGFTGTFMDFLKQKAMQTPAGLRVEMGGVGGGAGKPPMGYRFTASGDLEAIPGGPADAKAQAAALAKATGSEEMEVTISTLRDAYDRLEKGGGITSTKKEGLANILPSLSSSDVGQATGRLLGTANQSARNEIAMARPALLAALMKATGMTAKQIDSNAELKLWLATATDPKLDVEANRKALDNIERKYMRSKNTVATNSGLPIGSVQIGVTPDGKPVYQSPDGKKWVQ